MSEQQQNNSENRPIKSHRDGAVEVAVWRRETDKGPVFNTERTRSYQVKEGNWQKTQSIPERDLLKPATLDERAYESIQQMRQQARDHYIQQQKQAVQQAPQPEPERAR